MATIEKPHELAAAAVQVYETLLHRISPILGELGSHALFRRSVALTAAGFPCYAELRLTRQDDFLLLVGACLRKQEPQSIQEAAVALLVTYLELLTVLIGERLTWRLVQEAWPESGTEQGPEDQNARA